jgi:polyribonucleotide nucleotidyltransferase
MRRPVGLEAEAGTEALREAHKVIRALCDLQIELISKCNVQKKQYEVPPSDGVLEKIDAVAGRAAARLPRALRGADRIEGEGGEACRCRGCHGRG